MHKNFGNTVLMDPYFWVWISPFIRTPSSTYPTPLPWELEINFKVQKARMAKLLAKSESMDVKTSIMKHTTSNSTKDPQKKKT